MIPSLVVDWGPELRPALLMLTLGAILPGVVAVAAALLRRLRGAAAGTSWRRRARPVQVPVPVPARRWMPVETARLSSRLAGRSVRRHARRRDPTP